jgi:hypothetical protein
VSRRISKATPDNYLKGLILRGVGLGHHTSAEIIDHVKTTPYYYEEEDGSQTENWYDNERGVRSALTYLRNAGYLTLNPRDEHGNIDRTEQTRPYKWYLTHLGEEHARNPFIKKEHRDRRINEEAYRLFRDILQDEPAFQEAVRVYSQTHQIPKLNITQSKAPIIKNPRIRKGQTEKIIIENPDGTEREVTTEQLMSALKDVDSIRMRQKELSDTILMQQAEMQGYEQQIADMYYALEGKGIKVENIRRRNVVSMRTAQRKELVYRVSGIDPDQLESEIRVEIPVGAVFFEAWGNIWGRKVKGATLFKRGSVELMADTNPEVDRGHASHLLSYADMDNLGLFISKIRPTGITVSDFNHRMSKPASFNF